MNFNVCVVIVTYNRLTKLKKTLEYYDKQQLSPRYVVVVNNASTDSTSQFLQDWSNVDAAYTKKVITLKENTGGAGGFYEGEKFALQLPDVNWVMIADDDAYPMPDYLLGLKRFLIDKKIENCAIICGRVDQYDTCENIHRSFWTSKWNWNFHSFVPKTLYENEYFNPDFVSYVGILINKKALMEIGLVDRNLFIWNDDTEHSYRLRKYGEFICVPKYSMYHDVDKENEGLSWKSYYNYRNKTIFFKRHLKLQSVFVLSLLFIKTLLCPLKGRSFTELKLRLVAIKDGLLNNLGRNSVYKPGWKP